MFDIELKNWTPAILRCFSSEFLEMAIDNLAEGARAKWMALARQRLTSSKEDYVHGIQEVEAQPAVRIIRLLGALPNWVEQGMSPFDLRDTLLSSPRVHMSKDGHRYMSIPFRHGTPGSQGGAGTPMGRSYQERGGESRRADLGFQKADARALGKRIYDLAKKLKPGDRLPAGLAPLLAPHHTTDIYAGMSRVRHGYGRAVQSQYRTFRTISDRSDPAKWQHPGITARNLASEVEDWIRDNAIPILKSTMKEVLRGTR